jgi:hypothetical protein
MEEGPKYINYQGPPEEKAYWLRSAQQYMKRIEDGIGGHLLTLGFRTWERVIHGKGADGSKRHATIRGTNFIGSMGGFTNITIDVRGGKKELEPDEKLKKEIEEDMRIPWVIILGISDPANEARCIGAMILKPKLANGSTDGRTASDGFKVMRWIPRDEARAAEFDQLVSWSGPYYGFKETWLRESKQIKARYKLEECPRRSNMWELDYDDNSDSNSTDTGWEPGVNPDAYTYINTFPEITQPVSGPNLSGTYWNTDEYWDPGPPTELGEYWVKYDNTLYNGYATTVAGYPFDAWDASAYDIATWQNGYLAIMDMPNPDAFCLYYFATGRYHSWGHFAWPGGGQEGIELVNYAEYFAVHPWPADGIQRRTEESQYGGSEWWFFGGNTIFEYDNNSINRFYSEAEGVWSVSSSTEIYKYYTRTYYAEYDCSDVLAPDHSIENDVFDLYSKWMIAVVWYYEGLVTMTVDPCIDSYYWRDGGPGYSYPYYQWPEYTDPREDLVNFDLWFDDGAKIPMASDLLNDGTFYMTYAELLDMCVCNVKKEPVYAAHYKYAQAEAADWVEGDYGKFNTLVAYWKGKLFVSDKFSRTEEWANVRIDAFDCFADHGGYWNGNVRVGRLQISRERWGTKKAPDGTLKENIDAELREIPR